MPTASPAATATHVPTPVATARATATATAPAPGEHTWYTSAAGNAKYYYCELDDQWRDLSPKNLRSYPSEAALQAEWGAARTKYPRSKC